jgi:hypothetical protein
VATSGARQREFVFRASAERRPLEKRENAGWRFRRKRVDTRVERIPRCGAVDFPRQWEKRPTDCLIIRHSLLLIFSTVPEKVDDDESKLTNG